MRASVRRVYRNCRPTAQKLSEENVKDLWRTGQGGGLAILVPVTGGAESKGSMIPPLLPWGLVGGGGQNRDQRLPYIGTWRGES